MATGLIGRAASRGLAVRYRDQDGAVLACTVYITRQKKAVVATGSSTSHISSTNVKTRAYPRCRTLRSHPLFSGNGYLRPGFTRHHETSTSPPYTPTPNCRDHFRSVAITADEEPAQSHKHSHLGAAIAGQSPRTRQRHVGC